MQEIRVIIGLIVFCLGPIIMIVGFIQLFNSEKRQNGLKLLIFGVCAMVIGVNICQSGDGMS